MNLISAQPQGSWRKRPRTGIGVKRIRSAAPVQVPLDISAERIRQQCPIDPPGQTSERGNRYLLQPELKLARCSIPEQRHVAVEDRWLAVERSFANFGDELFDRGIVDVLGVDSVGAGKARQT